MKVNFLLYLAQKKNYWEMRQRLLRLIFLIRQKSYYLNNGLFSRIGLKAKLDLNGFLTSSEIDVLEIRQMKGEISFTELLDRLDIHR